MKTDIIYTFLQVSQLLFLVYLIAYASFLLISLVVAGTHLHEKSKKRKSQPKAEPLGLAAKLAVSVLVPAYNEEVTIIESLTSLLNLDYDDYEIIVIDDGSKDQTAQLVREHFGLEPSQRRIDFQIPCQNYKGIWEKNLGKVHLTLIQKENGGKGDALNMGINAASYDYFLCLDADSMLQRDSLKHIVTPVLEEEDVIAVGGLVQVAQGLSMVNGEFQSYKLPWKLLACSQVIEYDCSFLGSRILLDYLKSNLIISGAFGLFKRDLVLAAGGYDRQTLGEDMELVMKLHFFCRNNNIPYQIRYESNAVCWSQAPVNLGDLCKQRRRWFLGLFQCLVKYRTIFVNPRFGLVGFLSYLYYLLFELLSPFVELFGALAILISLVFYQLNLGYFFSLFSLYILYCTMMTLTSFLQRAYSQQLLLKATDIFTVVYAAIFRYLFLHWILNWVRVTSFFGYQKKKKVWGDLKREKQLDNLDILKNS
ncbi:glycosyltransferase family 2 protein [Streptococcus oricebi]|uniref:Glycosyltransferase 2-like domain-containing protein n=1 Tax=Streptococcus oricebi TaxID=1547447 RepID=A0ABS5B2Y5_9STRE|nr:glycosyltransferase [Streptococcus oricebi]MBP2622324.1 hypothetical protein [Streptococcus oricebi]